MQVEVIVFGQLTDITGTNKITIENAGDTDSLIRQLQMRYPALTGANYRIAVEKQIISANTPLQHNHTVALLPPFAGG